MTGGAPLSALPDDRTATLDGLECGLFDLVLIGGGITGAGIARDAALRGLSVALLEASDFAAGTSSRSSKLIHGGLRYLAMGDVALVRETALERTRVYRLAPHLAEPRWMLLPTRSLASAMKFRAAVTAYEKLGAVTGADIHRNLAGEDLAREEPLLRRDRYSHAVAYREYLTDDARLVLANLRCAAEHGAVALNHAAVHEITMDAGRVDGVVARDARTGREFRVRARCVVNAAGPWVEGVRGLVQTGGDPWLHLSKGVHIGIPLERLPVENMVVMNADDRRTLFVIPRDGVVYVGTTDTTHSAGPAVWPEIEKADVDYLLAPLSQYFDTAPISRDDVVTAWAGLRPLVAQAGKKAVDISRKDEIHIGAGGLVSIAGGKLTGYRKMAVNIMKTVEAALGRTLPEADPDLALPGGDFSGDFETLADSIAVRSGLDERTARRLVRLYGAEAEDVLALDSSKLRGDDRVVGGEIDWGVARELAVTLEDMIYRRLRVALYEPGTAERIAVPVAERMGALLGWDDDERSNQVRSVRARLASDLTFVGEGER